MSNCSRCNGPIFAAENPMIVQGHKYHEACFKCVECGTKLTLRTYESEKGIVYCKPHTPQNRASNSVKL